MFYVGHFTYTGVQRRPQGRGRAEGWFTSIVEAESAEEAGEKLRELVKNAGACLTPFQELEFVFLDALIEGERLPEEGVIAHFVGETEDEDTTVDISLPAVSSEFCRAYFPRGAADNGEQEPFVTFER
jgi:hypothetical protein